MRIIVLNAVPEVQILILCHSTSYVVWQILLEAEGIARVPHLLRNTLAILDDVVLAICLHQTLFQNRSGVGAFRTVRVLIAAFAAKSLNLDGIKALIII